MQAGAGSRVQAPGLPPRLAPPAVGPQDSAVLSRGLARAGKGNVRAFLLKEAQITYKSFRCFSYESIQTISYVIEVNPNDLIFFSKPAHNLAYNYKISCELNIFIY